MDIIYDIKQIGENKILFNYTVNSNTPLFSVELIDPWTFEEKTAIIIPEGDDGEWILNFQGVAQGYEDLNSGMITFTNIGTWTANIYESSVLIENTKLQVN